MYKYLILLDTFVIEDSNFKFLTEENAIYEAEQIIEKISNTMHRHPIEFDIEIRKI